MKARHEEVSKRYWEKMWRDVDELFAKVDEQPEEDTYFNNELETAYWDWVDEERNRIDPEPNPVSKDNPRL